MPSTAGLRGPIDHHFHDCPNCGHIWSHRRRDIPSGEFDAAHKCPKCKTGEDYIARRTIAEVYADRRRDRPIWKRMAAWFRGAFS